MKDRPNEKTTETLLECERIKAWNEAIEAAANICDTQSKVLTLQIRKLKK